jgi:hypothetical protein
MVLAVCLWAFVWIGPYIFRGRLVVVIELLSCALFIALLWVDRQHGYWRVLLSVFVAAFAIPFFLRGDLVSVAQGGVCLFVGYWWFRYGRNAGAETLKVTNVKASDLAGVVEYDERHLAGVSVEECTEDWTQRISLVQTDAQGRFSLPHGDAAVHYVRVSRSEAGTVHLRVELSANARPLLVQLRPRRASVFD